ncbi:MAG: putative Phosphoenolpyruvate synthase [Nitrospira sp.]|jgi:pyruvate,water dikinase|nr:putative Phosphoenolpyruvate synthase [Nitrospira sp.]
MSDPQILLLEKSRDPRLVGGKAAGLAALIAAGFPVPRGLCITTAVYRLCLETGGIDGTAAWKQLHQSSEEQRALQQGRVRDVLSTQPWAPGFQSEVDRHLAALACNPLTGWAVRSSATNEDAAEGSAAGLYRTTLGVSSSEVLAAIRDCWISVWDERMFQYSRRSGGESACPEMAVVIQPMLEAKIAGVAYSIHPVTGRTSQVAINAVFGLASLLVSGNVTPDQYVVEMAGEPLQPLRIHRRLVPKRQRLVATANGLQAETIPSADQEQSSLSDGQLFDLALLAKQIEAAFRHPIDLEWAWDAQRLWILQSRPITAVRPSHALTNDECEWTRANFKETMPELPSPLGLSYLEQFMDAYMIAPYRRLGCTVPETLSSVRVFHGRPYLNVTLFYSLVVQLYGNPAFLTEQMGGEPLAFTPPVRPMGPLALIRAGLVMMREWRKVRRQASANFSAMKELDENYRADRIQHLSLPEVTETLDYLRRWLHDHELTFWILGGVAQSLQALGTILPGWLGRDWRELLNASLQGQGTVISAQQIVRLAELVEVAKNEAVVQRWFLSESELEKDYRKALAGTSFLTLFERYVADYGHRGVGESDVMSPRMADQPEAILTVLRTQVRSGETASVKEIVSRQTQRREAALAEITKRFGRWRHRRLIFGWWYRRLCRFCALREANRHHLMYYSTVVRRLLLRVGDLMVDQGTLTQREDVFFLTLGESSVLGQESARDWRTLVQDRREERSRQETLLVPDTIRNWAEICDQTSRSIGVTTGGELRGIVVSAGMARGPVRIVRSTADWKGVRRGDIVVVPVIDPGMVPLFGLAAGLIAEMGGTLSHGAIIAREYGLPVLVNVPHATSLLREDEQVHIASATGTIRRVIS